jgi:hypothetical protein
MTEDRGSGIRPALARRLQLNSTEVERLRSWSFIDDPHKIGLGQGIGNAECGKKK